MLPPNIKKHYDLLEIGPEADRRAVERAFRDLAVVWHPDRFAGNQRLAAKAEKRLKQLGAARAAILGHLADRERVTPKPAASRPQSGKARSSSHAVIARPRLVLRGIARMTDTALFGLFVVYADLEVGPAASLTGLLLFPFFVSLGWVFFEAGFLSTIGTTPGKWLTRTEIVPRSMRPPTYRDTLQRSLRVWFQGLGSGLFPLCLITVAGSGYYLKKKGYTPWDAAEGFFISHYPLGIRWCALTVAALMITGLYQPFLEKQLLGIKKAAAQTRIDPPPPAPRPAQKAEILMRRAARQIDRGQYAKALNLLDQVARITPEAPRIHYLAGFALAKQGLLREAARRLHQAIALDPSHAKAYHTLGLVYLNLGDRHLAMEQYRVLADIDAKLAAELLTYIRGSQPPPPDSQWQHDFFLSGGFHRHHIRV
jgi:hypothetical protein